MRSSAKLCEFLRVPKKIDHAAGVPGKVISGLECIDEVCECLSVAVSMLLCIESWRVTWSLPLATAPPVGEQPEVFSRLLHHTVPLSQPSPLFLQPVSNDTTATLQDGRQGRLRALSLRRSDGTCRKRRQEAQPNPDVQT